MLRFDSLNPHTDLLPFFVVTPLVSS
jgi:hypothetical protein